MASASSPKLVVSILAANGLQSSSIVKYLLSQDEFSNQFRLRAIVRDPTKYESPADKHPDEVVAGDMNDQSSLERALSGTDVLWAMTSPDPEAGIEAEIKQGETIVNAFVRSASPSHSKPLLLFSSSIDVDAITKGEIKMVNATSKSRIESYVHSVAQKENTFRFTFVHPGMFMQNFLTYQKPTVDDKGLYHFTGSVRTDVQIPFVDITDLGPLVWHLLQQAHSSDATSYGPYDGATIRLYGEYLSYPELVEQFSQSTQNRAVYDYFSVPKFLSVFFGGTETEAKAQLDPRHRQNGKETIITMIGDMYNLINRYGYYGTGAPDFDEYEKDVRMQKVVGQQPSKRTTWKEFIAKSFNESDSSGGETAVLSLPANFPGISSLTRAERFLYEHISYFVKISRAGPDAHADFDEDVVKPNFHPSGVVEFPYFPKGLRESMGLKPLSSPDEDGVILSGHDEILAYFKDWRKTFYFETGDLISLASLSSSAASRKATPRGALLEAHLVGTVTFGPQPKTYVQDYLCAAFVDDEGKVVRYQEYWEPSRFTS